VTDYASLLSRIEERLREMGAPCREVDCCGCDKYAALVGWALERVATLRIVFGQIAAEGELRLSPMIQVLADQSRLLLEREVESLARALGLELVDREEK
jgi:hypothetical protein